MLVDLILSNLHEIITVHFISLFSFDGMGIQRDS